MKNLRKFNESLVEFFFRPKVDWKFVKNIEDVTTEYIDKGYDISVTLSCGGEMFYSNDQQFFNDDEVDFTELKEYIGLMLLVNEDENHDRDDCCTIITDMTNKIRKRYGYVCHEDTKDGVFNTEVCNYDVPVK